MRLVALAALAASAVSGSFGVTFAAFSGSTINTGNSFSANATFPPVFVRHVGSAVCGATSNAVTVPAGGIPAGRTLVLQIVLRGGSYRNAVSATDSRGNTYRTDVDVTFAAQTIRTIILSSYVTTALLAGDAITVSHGSANSSGVAVDEFRRIPSTGYLNRTGTGTGDSAAPSATTSTATTVADAALYGGVGAHRLQTFTEPGGWTTAHQVQQDCGNAMRETTNHGAYRIVAATGSYTYNPTLSIALPWTAAIAAYSG